MWASRPSYYDDDMPIDLRKKVVLQRNLEEQKESQRKENVFAPRENLVDLSQGRWHHPPALPVINFYPFMSERYGGVRCSLVNSDEKVHDSKYGSRGTLETAIRKLHQNSQFKKASEPPKEERCRSTDTVLEKDKDTSFESKRSSSCPDLTVILPTTPPRPCKPSPLKPKSSFIQRSSGYISDGPTNSITNNFHHQDPDHHSNSSQPIGGARKRKSFIPVYGDRAPSPKRRPRSPVEHHSPYDEYFSHPEVLLRRQLQQHDPSPYLVHVYDYYQQLVQRLRENSSSNVRLPPPVSPTSADDDMPTDGNRKRPCRALTGKHVRQGTGASLSTLLTLRQKIQERQKAKEHQPRTGFNGICNKSGGTKKSKMQKAKENSKSLLLNKIQNC